MPPRRATGCARCLERTIEENPAEGKVHSEECQEDIEGLSGDVQPDRLAADKLGGQLPEI